MSEKQTSPSRALGMKVLYATLKALAEAGGSLSRQEVIQHLERSVEFTDWESSRAGKNQNIRWRSHLFYTVDAIRAGYMTKADGVWSITDAGKEALAHGPERLTELARAAYKEWYQETKMTDSNGDSNGNSKLGAWARSQIFHQGMLLLEKAAGNALPTEVLFAQLPAKLPDDLQDALTRHDKHWTTSYGYRTFYRAAKAGWINRSSGVWTLTESGINALSEFKDAKRLWESAKSLYSDAGESKEILPYLGGRNDFAAVPQALYRSQSATIGQLVSDIQRGTLALPDIQRPFVWKNTKVRDLLDSIFKGFPFGFILTWKNPGNQEARAIGTSAKGSSLPYALVIDGQQRLTSLYAVVTGDPILDKQFRKRQIRIAFHPIQGVFEVADAAIEKNPEWIPDITALFAESMGALAVVKQYLERLTTAREITNEHAHTVEANIQRLVNLKNIPLGVLEVGLDASEEQVAEIFVRINSQGQNLKQADFILTLLAVHWQEGREQLEAFSRSCITPAADSKPSAFNWQLRPGAHELIRVGVALGHRRARLSAAYQVLRGKDPESGLLSAEARDDNLRRFAEAQSQVLDFTNWHEFLKVLSTAGYRSEKQILSVNTALYSYALFLLGREYYGLSLQDLRPLVARWYMMSVITGRYVGGATESSMEEDLARLRTIQGGDSKAFKSVLEEAMGSELTNDFWRVTLPSRLESSSSRTSAPFFAAQCVLGASALYSPLSVAELLDPSRIAKKSNLEAHHLFPKAWLKRSGFKAPREYNQVANMALLEWPDNILVSDSPPRDYAPKLEERLDPVELSRQQKHHALPPEWWELEYMEFLEKRRYLMAEVIYTAYSRLGNE